MILGYRAVLDRQAVGLGLTVLVELKVDQHSDTCATELQAALRAEPAVISAHIVSGSADVRLEVVVPDLQAYARLLFGTLLALPHVSDVTSNVALRTVKPLSPLAV